MRILLSGATGYVGGFILADAAAHDDEIIALSRFGRQVAGAATSLRFDLNGDMSEIPVGIDALVHCAFDHVPGRYRGGEGDDPEGFLARNVQGSLKLFEAARRVGAERIVFLSSRAVYDGHPAGTVLTEDLPLDPASLYGRAKFDVETALVALAETGLITSSLRATGIYGTSQKGGWHKWQDLFQAFEAGENIAPRIGTEVHGADLAAAVRLVLMSERSKVSGQRFNVSDLCLDRRDLLDLYATRKGIDRPLPDHSDAAMVSQMDCTRLSGLGWQPQGQDGLLRFLAELG
ncbi:NAD-dependent epimerase/dehydratase family protein [Qingshengfaniella alkalisoli]|uniref:NAD(P)-dependent oxidoreductase n=1 Tax=Qingshengfaniella alkalisoli TaxID=2599296 RepID=A0A5B8IX69_9RHOB|nr:NAD(P)-dependent oxidoreductase [Qingshengfaniella alkalisoli]QDY69501.1 NAD(P)-dependent oxidoreductase [Qingshengfaniella alkalisoli]